MLEIEAANANTKAKEVALASMMIGVEIIKAAQHRVAKEEAVVRESRHAQIHRRVISWPRAPSFFVLKSHPFYVLACVPATGECVSMNFVVIFLKAAMYADADMMLA